MRFALLSTPLLLLVACQAAPPPAVPASTPAPAPTPAAIPAPAPEPAQPAVTEQPAPAASKEEPADEGPTACPEGMKLVDGDFCTEVEQTCTKSWWDGANKKKVCENFAAPSRCVGEKVHKRFCVDTYAYPNIKGARPEVMNNFYQAQVRCAALDKRVCTENEWTMACEGPEMKPYPYGYERDATKCNGDHKYDFPDMDKVRKRDPKELERLWLGVPSGTQDQCISDYGVADLPGNEDELASSESFTGWRNKYDNVTTGGPWYLGVRNQCRPKIYTHDEGFYYYYLSFRCCAEPDGQATDPRAPKQIKAGTSFKTIERKAGITVDEAKKRQPDDFERARQLGAQQMKDRGGKPADAATWTPNEGRDKQFVNEHKKPKQD